MNALYINKETKKVALNIIQGLANKCPIYIIKETKKGALNIKKTSVGGLTNL